MGMITYFILYLLLAAPSVYYGVIMKGHFERVVKSNAPVIPDATIKTSRWHPSGYSWRVLFQYNKQHKTASLSIYLFYLSVRGLFFGELNRFLFLLDACNTWMLRLDVTSVTLVIHIC